MCVGQPKSSHVLVVYYWFFRFLCQHHQKYILCYLKNTFKYFFLSISHHSTSFFSAQIYLYHVHHIIRILVLCCFCDKTLLIVVHLNQISFIHSQNMRFFGVLNYSEFNWCFSPFNSCPQHLNYLNLHDSWQFVRRWRWRRLQIFSMFEVIYKYFGSWLFVLWGWKKIQRERRIYEIVLGFLIFHMTTMCVCLHKKYVSSTHETEREKNIHGEKSTKSGCSTWHVR